MIAWIALHRDFLLFAFSFLIAWLSFWLGKWTNDDVIKYLRELVEDQNDDLERWAKRWDEDNL